MIEKRKISCNKSSFVENIKNVSIGIVILRTVAILVLKWKVNAETCNIVCFVLKRLTDVKKIEKKKH